MWTEPVLVGWHRLSNCDGQLGEWSEVFRVLSGSASLSRSNGRERQERSERCDSGMRRRTSSSRKVEILIWN